MLPEQHIEVTTIKCPICKGEGRVKKIISNYTGNPEYNYTGVINFETSYVTCDCCRGSGVLVKRNLITYENVVV